MTAISISSHHPLLQFRTPTQSLTTRAEFSLPIEQELISTIKTCNSIRSLEQVHAQLIKTNLLLRDPVIAVFFVSCANLDRKDSTHGCVDYAYSIFLDIADPSIFLSNNIMRACVTSLQCDKALSIYHRLINELEFQPNKFSFPPLIKACAYLSRTDCARELHAQIIVRGFRSDLHINTALAHVYATSGYFSIAAYLFAEIPQRDLVSWVTAISTLSQENPAESLRLFRAMQLQGILPNEIAMVCVLTSCAKLAALATGIWIHSYITKAKLDKNVRVVTALVDMYSKCGSIELAKQVFFESKQKNAFTWTVMIKGLAIHGLGQEALNLFDTMKKERVEPDALTLLAVLSACNHAGLVDEARYFFKSMTSEYGISPTFEHYGCMVDLLGRQGLLNEAWKLIEEIPREVNSVILRSFLSSCRIHRNLKMGEMVGHKLLHLEPEYDANYLLLSNLYASQGKWDEAGKIRRIMKERGIEKIPGSSYIEVNGFIQEFIVADRDHIDNTEVYKSLRDMMERIKDVGYIPQISEVLLNLNNEEKEESLLCHSEKLAIAYGLVNTKPGTVIRVVNNMRICGDCHLVMKLVSKVFKRKVIIRDCLRFHCFTDGFCSCKDQW